MDEEPLNEYRWIDSTTAQQLWRIYYNGEILFEEWRNL